MRNVILVAIIAISTVLSGCATVIKGTEQTLTFNSQPDGAQVILDGQPVGVTPLIMKVKKNHVSSVTVKKDGYVTQVLPIEKKFDGVTLLSIFWDLSTTDIVSGAAYEYAPNTFYFELKKAEAPK
ncbi:MAG: PEGA domain-containing protein [Gammaproteobacteria bacterium]|nr:PEGA domain-containing protein [Sideroxydans sp.]MBU3903792.1 PEGA domain-containing protein [Gammaproteobacteria bacterium]MBU4150734.1 PEGA domain-containing protein [Gammaproteobacteria bacterium]